MPLIRGAWLSSGVRQVTRRLIRHWRTSLPVIVVLALGLGTASAMFSALDQTLLRSLPFPRADRLVVIRGVTYPGLYARSRFRVPMFTDLELARGVFSITTAFAEGDANFEDPRLPLRVHVAQVTPSFFRTMQVPPLRGRAFDAEDAESGAPLVAILSHTFWRRVFGDDSPLGHTVLVGGRIFLVIGVMPPGFSFPGQSDMWIPMSNPIHLRTLAISMSAGPTALARLASGASVQMADRRIQEFWRQAEHAIGPDDSVGRADFRQRMQEKTRAGLVTPLRTELAGAARNAVMVLFGATILLLLVTCANVAGLLIADGNSRRCEFAMRRALGARRGRLAMALLGESVLMGVAGAVLGLAVAAGLLRVVGGILPASVAQLFVPRLDVPMATFTFVMGFLSALGFGLWPAIVAGRTDLLQPLQMGTLQAGGAARGFRASRLLLVGELAISVVLVGAALAVLQQFARLTTTPAGIRSAGVGTLRVAFDPGATRLASLRAIVDSVEATAGVDAAGLVSNLPMANDGREVSILFHGLAVQWVQCSGGYFATLGIPIVRGRTFKITDDSAGPSVIIVDRVLTDSLWPGLDPIGRRLPFGKDGESTIVGVVGSVRTSIGAPGPGYTMYFPIGQWIPRYVSVVARSRLPGDVLLARMEEAVRRAVPGQPAFNIRTMPDVLRAGVATQRTHTLLLGLFAGLAVLVTGLGVNSVVTRSISEQRRALAIRMALGASPGDLLRTTFRNLGVVVLAGVAVGAALSWAARRAIQPLLSQRLASTTPAFAAAVVVVMVGAALASFGPLKQAMAVDPMRVLREP
jgi:predicted permease